MAKKKKHEEHVNHERWLVSYADFITLLFATFTALFAMSNADKTKLEKAAKSIKEAFSSPSANPIIAISLGKSAGGGSLALPIPSASAPAAPPPKPSKSGTSGKDEDDSAFEHLFNGKAMNQASDEGTEDLNNNSGTPTPTPTPTPPPSQSPGTEGSGNEAMAKEIKELMKNFGLNDAVEVREEKRGTVISLGEAAFFATGGIDVLPACTQKLDKIVNALRNKDYEIRVEGHTDNTPIHSERFRSNLELSTMRASSIVDFMIKNYRFDPKALSASGYGETRPLGPNDTEAGRQKNRRVDIVILNERARGEEPK